MLLHCKLRQSTVGQPHSCTSGKSTNSTVILYVRFAFCNKGCSLLLWIVRIFIRWSKQLQCITSIVKIQVLWSSAEESERGEHLLLDEPESLHQSDCRRSNSVQRWRVLWHQWAESFSWTNRTIWHETPQRNTHVAHSQSTSGTEGWLIWVYFFKNQELTKKSTLSITPIFV